MKRIILLLCLILVTVSINLQVQHVSSKTDHATLPKLRANAISTTMATNTTTPHSVISLLSDGAVKNMAYSDNWQGNGSAISPYIIKNYSFTGVNGVGTGIDIENVQEHILIEYNSIQSFPNGIFLINSKNIIIRNNILTNLTIAGIHLENSSAIIANNSIYSNGQVTVHIIGTSRDWTYSGYGINVFQSTDVAITNNRIGGNLIYNLNLESDVNVNITGNYIQTRPNAYDQASVIINKCTNLTVSSNSFIDVLLSDDVNSINIQSSESIWILSNYFYRSNLIITGISNLTIASNIYKQTVLQVYQSGNLTVFNNSFIASFFSDNTDYSGSNFSNNYFTDYSSFTLFNIQRANITRNYIENQIDGLKINNGLYNTISFNYFTNVIYELDFVNSSTTMANNTFYGNNFMDKNISLILGGTNNFWDNGSYGNYWATYTGTDVNKDNIGDTKYNLTPLLDSTVVNHYDNYPLMNQSLLPDLSYFTYTIAKINSLIDSSTNLPVQYPSLTITTPKSTTNPGYSSYPTEYSTSTSAVVVNSSNNSGFVFILAILVLLAIGSAGYVYFDRKGISNTRSTFLPPTKNGLQVNKHPNQSQMKTGKICPRCFAQAELNDKFCMNCGNELF